MNNEDSLDLQQELALLGKGRVPRKVTSSLYEFYLSGEITDPEDYINWYDVIRHCTPDDTVKIYINSAGGNLFTSIQFLRVLSETEAQVIVSVEGLCASAATLVFLAADIFEVTPHSMFLFHTYSGGTFGKGSEMHAQIIHEKAWCAKLFSEIYEDFLTSQEITDMLVGRDIWLSTDEVAERMNKRIAKRQELAELEEATAPD